MKRRTKRRLGWAGVVIGLAWAVMAMPLGLEHDRLDVFFSAYLGVLLAVAGVALADSNSPVYRARDWADEEAEKEVKEMLQ